VEQSASFEAIVEVGTTGLVGTIEVQIQDNLSNTLYGPTALGIIESPAGSGFYQGTLTAPALIGQYSIIWSDDGTFSENHTFVDDLTVVAAGAGDALPPISPIGPGPGAVPGPCNAWTTAEEIAACCSAEVGSDIDLFDEVATSASRILYELSGRLFTGACDRTVRPCGTPTCGFQVLSRGHIVGWDGMQWEGTPCGCHHLSRVKLSGYPVREIVEVKIDGAVVPDTDYRLDEWRFLTRMDGGLWPTCQHLDLDDTEAGTFSVRYTYGQNPPQIGQAAARDLACELYKMCSGSACALPQGTTRVSRQGIVIEKLAFTAWAYTPATNRGRAPGWNTGIPTVDAFLSAYNRAGIMRRPAVWSPSSKARYARPVGP